jgi:tetraacyldisaccharide 4'-kinase
MKPSREQALLRLLSGDTRGPGAVLARGGLRTLEPLYATAMRLRNFAFDRGWKKSHALPAPAISVGNLTTGGTGKTPVVRWLVERLRDAGYSPAILMRGYRIGECEVSDEQLMLEDQLHRHKGRRVIVHAEADRVDGARHVAKHEAVDVFVLDDAFQHRRAGRDFDLVLINATEPFGFGHVLPRGLLREPIAGIRRADAIVLTRADQVSLDDVAEIERVIRAHHCGAPVYRARHALVAVLDGPDSLPIDTLRERPFFAFAGIGNPAALEKQLAGFGATFAGQQWFADHHDFRYADLEHVTAIARDRGAEALVTTEKDWPKLRRMKLHELPLPVLRLAMAIRFAEDDEARLFDQILRVLPRRSPPVERQHPPDAASEDHPA